MEMSGTASLAPEYTGKRIDFNRLLKPYPLSVFEFRYKGDYMEYMHISDGDLLIIDCAKKPFDGCVALVIFEGQILCRQILFSKKWNCYVFKNYTRWERVTQLYGVVTHNIHTLSGRQL